MTAPVRRTALAVLSLLGILAVALTYQQTVAASDYREDVRNTRGAQERTERPRGRILTADGVVIARSIGSPDDPDAYVRSYPEGGLYAHLTGYSTSVFGDTGLEAAEAERLRSDHDGSLRAVVLGALGADLGPDDITLTVRDDLQRAAAEALDGRRGAAVVLDPRSGAVLAMVSNPTFDPNDLIGEGALEAGAALTTDPQSPLLDRAAEGLYPPGSTFKLVTAAAGLVVDFVTPSTRLPDTDELPLPGTTSTITNFDGGFCGDGDTVTLQRAVAISCNTAFADLGMRLGAELLVEAAEDAGWNEPIPFELDTAASQIPDPASFGEDLPAVAQSALGQRDVRATPLQMALVAAAIANGGEMMTPYLVESSTAPDGTVTDVADPRAWRRWIPAEEAGALEQMMISVVAEGSGWRAQIPGLTLAGKTGTAEVPDSAPDVWFVAIAPAAASPGEAQIAVAVLVEAGGTAGEEATGGSVAAPIAKEIIEAWLRTTNR